MENAPVIPETDDNEDGKTKKKSRRSYGLGHLAFEAGNNEKNKQEEKSWFNFLAEKDKEKDRGKDQGKDKDQTRVDKEEAGASATSPELGESAAPVESISETEAAEIRPKIVEAIETVEANAESDPDTDAPVERFREIVKETGDADQAYEEVLSDLDSTPEEVSETETEAVESDNEIDSEEELPSDAAESPEEHPQDDELYEDQEVLLNRIETNESEDVEDGADAGTGQGQGRVPPHQPPAPPRGPQGSGPFGPHGSGPNGPNFNQAPLYATAGVAANQAPRQAEPEYYYNASPAAMALFGGIIGYLIGRRRGRIKTEKKLIPIQKKLEKQVEDLRFDLQEKEKTIRRVAAEKVKEQGQTVLEVFKNPKEFKPETAAQIKNARERAPEATELHGPSKRHEHLAHIIVNAEAAKAETAKNEKERDAEQQKQTARQNSIEINKNVENLNRNELLSLSEKISVNGTSLRQIYESHLIGERGLRRLIHEHLRGGDIKKALKLEIEERELDFERDPLLRDMPVHNMSGGGGSPVSGQAALQHLLKKADAALEDTSEEAAYYKARSEYEAKQYKQKQQNRQVLDITLVSVITSLVAVIAYLLITRI